MSNGPKHMNPLDGLVSQALTDLTTQKVEEASRTKYAMLEGLAKEYIAATGHNPKDVTLVEQMKDGAIVYYFALKSDVGV